MKTKARLAALAVATLTLLGSVSAALAHAAYVRSEPGAGAVVASAPAALVIWFEQDMFRRAGENRIEVLGPDGAAVQTGDAAIDDDDRRKLSVPLSADLAPGEYTVNWRTLSAEDGDDAEGSFTFTYDPAASVTSTPMLAPATPTDLPVAATPTVAAAAPSATPAASTGFGCGGALAPGLGLVVLGGLGGWRSRRRKDGK